MRHCGIDPGVFERQEETVDLTSYLAFFEAASATAGDPHFALHAARMLGTDGLGALSFLFLSAPTLREAFSTFVSRVDAMQKATFNCFIEGQDVSHFTYYVRNRQDGPMRHDSEYSIGVMHMLVRKYLGSDFRPFEVHFTHERCGDYRFYADYFECPVFFEQPQNRLLLGSKLLDERSRVLDGVFFPIADAYLKSRLHPDELNPSVAQRVHDLILRRSLNDLPRLEETAALLHLSRSTLIRRLSREGLRYSTIVLDRRMAFARDALVERRRSVTDIALAAGYAESASFCRAFSTHHGETPSRWRRRQRLGTGDTG